MSDGIVRIETGPRMSQAVTFNGVVYLAGQVGTAGDSVADQTRQCLEKVEALLKQCNSSKERILQAVVWLADMADFEEMNSVWDAWVPQSQTPGRACGEAKLAHPDLKVEFIITAAQRIENYANK